MIRTSDAVDLVCPALVAIQATAAGVMTARRIGQAGNRRYSFVPLDHIMQRLVAPLANASCAIVWSVHGAEVCCTLLHTSGQWISASAWTEKDEKQRGVQALGSALTYGKRYSAMALFGIVSTEDDDGSAASERQPTDERPRGDSDRPPRPPRSSGSAAGAGEDACRCPAHGCGHVGMWANLEGERRSFRCKGCKGYVNDVDRYTGEPVEDFVRILRQYEGGE